MTPTTVRIDKWLWAARFFKTRSLSTAALENGKVRIGDDRVKPSRNLKIGEILQIDNGSTKWEVQVLALSDQRGPATVAQLLYAETTQSVANRQIDAERKKYFREPAANLKGRPTKRDRRQLEHVLPEE